MRTLWVLIALLTNGCSFMFVQGAPAQHQRLPDFDCVSAPIAPAVDSIVAGAGVYSTVLMAGVAADAQPNHIIPPGIFTMNAVMSGILSAVFVSSAVYGFANAASCAEAKELLEKRQAQKRCETDRDCYGGRVCVDTRCVSPPPAPVTVEPITPWG